MHQTVEVICYGVGHGDCIYVKLPKLRGKSGDFIEILIDTGELFETKQVINRIKSEHRNIDYVFLTHEHSDHIGGIVEILNTSDFRLRGIHYWTPIEQSISPSNIYKIKTLRQKSCLERQIVHCEEIDRSVIRRLDHIFNGSLKILFPQSFAMTQYNLSDKNRNSIVIDFIIESHHFLFMADADTAEEKEILSYCQKQDIDLSKTVVWKIGHHCSGTSSRVSFVNTLINNNLLAAICSCREDWEKVESTPPPNKDKIKKINKKLLSKGLNEIVFTSDCGSKRDLKLKFKITVGGVSLV